MEKVNLRYASIYISGVNLITITGFKGYDPEVRTDFNDLGFTYGWNFYSAPQAKTISIGMNVSF
jgi:hypothetical protein